MTESTLCFGRFRLDLARHQLFLDERPLQLGDRARQVLCVLSGAKGALVPKDELMARVWDRSSRKTTCKSTSQPCARRFTQREQAKVGS